MKKAALLSILIAMTQLAVVVIAQAQQPGKVARIGLLGGMSAAGFADRIQIFRQQLRELGYTEGKNFTFEERWAAGKLERLGALAADLVARRVDVIVTFGGSAPAFAAKKATTAIPIVMAAGGSDPKKERAGAILVTANPLFFTHLGQIANLAIMHRLAAIHSQKEFVEAGGLMMYGPSEAEIYRRAAIYVDKILKGANPGELPVERPAKFHLIFNLKTAKQIGLTIPPNVLARADRVIR